MDKRRWIVYLIRCSDESLYCGITNNLKNRLIAHNSGRGAKYTRFRRPVELVVASSEMTKSDAFKLEYRVKQVPASKKKYELKKGRNPEMKNLKKNLQAVNREIKALSKKVDRMIVTVGKLEKPKAIKAKPIKKTAIIAKPVKKVAAKKPAAKKTAKPSAIDTILVIINKSKKGVEITTLKKKTGFKDNIIHNIVYKLKNQGKIKSVGRGVYLKA